MKRLLALTLITFTLTIFAPSAHADILQSVGDGLKTAGTFAKDLFVKGKDKVMGLFNSADPEKIPYLVKKLQESQYALHTKQQGLLELYGLSDNATTSGSAKPIPDSYIQERVNDLKIAREENLKELEALKKLVAACDDKKKDYSQYNSEISKVTDTQIGLDKNQQVLEQKLAKYMNGSTTSGSSSDENPSGLSDSELSQRFNSADNPYTSAGIGNDSTSEESQDPSYEPGLSSDKPQAPASTSKSIDPNSTEVKALIDKWLAMKGLDPYGRLLGNGITAAGNADTGGLTRETWLMSNIPELRKYVKDNMGQTSTTTATITADKTATSEDRPSTTSAVASSTTPSAPVASSMATADAHSASNASMEALKGDITSGSGSTDAMKTKYEQYLAADQNRREVLSQQHQATSQP